MGIFRRNKINGVWKKNVLIISKIVKVQWIRRLENGLVTESKEGIAQKITKQ